MLLSTLEMIRQKAERLYGYPSIDGNGEDMTGNAERHHLQPSAHCGWISPHLRYKHFKLYIHLCASIYASFSCILRPE